MTSTIPVIQPPAPDERALQEANSYAQGSLEEEAKKNEHNRRERLRYHMGCAAVVLFWMAVLGVTAMGIAWFWHMVTPIPLHYLEEAQVNKIQGMLFSGVVASVIPVYAKKYM